ncbi:flagellar biosynthesis protein FliQ [Thiopseudomonas acetoxidans]|uniref:Flagellar biosynthetic protein FliQ n=1 Tax=Thiopseudomonas acetoxidans TaxID=3041622 RepID=A0ABT7SM61_9GAMM|nr:flagellar biosynthesis protein FliQ [Thiopseudomonas sp. CY1220]MDM7857104.1 flagellar biosynthesis protein FliQ [Thiopseudomonas sp. CY1220]NLC09486.1 flagellar biosynthesis protein FliQ [Gammaproteobacteria bacterium]
MTPEIAVDIFREALWLMAMAVATIITPSLVIGLIVAMFQAATQINEQTLSFLPRLLVSFMTLLVMGPWLVGRWLDFTTKLFESLPYVLG